MYNVVRNLGHTPQNVDFLLNLTKSIRKMARAKMGFSRIRPKMSFGARFLTSFDMSRTANCSALSVFKCSSECNSPSTADVFAKRSLTYLRVAKKRKRNWTKVGNKSMS